MNYNSRFEQIKRSYWDNEPIDNDDVFHLIGLIDEYQEQLEDAYRDIEKLEDKLEDLNKQLGEVNE